MSCRSTNDGSVIQSISQSLLWCIVSFHSLVRWIWLWHGWHRWLAHIGGSNCLSDTFIHSLPKLSVSLSLSFFLSLFLSPSISLAPSPSFRPSLPPSLLFVPSLPPLSSLLISPSRQLHGDPSSSPFSFSSSSSSSVPFLLSPCPS